MHPAARYRALDSAHDHRVPGSRGVTAGQRFFRKLLSVSRPDDLDIPARFSLLPNGESRHGYHAPRQIVDPNR